MIKVKIRCTPLWVWLLCLPHLAAAQWRGPVLSYLGPAEGLSSTVNDITQDSLGYIYLATHGGMYRYDGHQFNFFGHNPRDSTTLSAGEVNMIKACSDGLIWLGMRFSGLNSFDPKTEKIEHYPLPALPFRSIPGITAIHEDPDGTLWLGGSHFQLYAFDRRDKTFTTYTPSDIKPVEHGGRLFILSIIPDMRNENLLWLSVLDYGSAQSPSNTYGLVAFDKQTKQFSDAPCFGDTKYMDADGNLWGIYWGNAITRFDPVKRTCDVYYQTYMHNGQRVGNVSCDLEYYNDQLLLATTKALITVQENRDFSVLSRFDAQDINLACLYTDQSRNLWIGASQGAFILDPGNQHIRFFSLEQHGMTFRIYPGRLAYDPLQETVFLAYSSETDEGRIYTIPVDETSDQSPGMMKTTHPVTGITRDVKGRFWTSTNDRIMLFDPDRNTLLPPADRRLANEQIPRLWNLQSNSTGWVAGIGYDEFIWFHPDRKDLQRVLIDELPGSDYAKSFDNYFDGFTLTDDHNAYLFSNEVVRLDLENGESVNLRFDRQLNPNYNHIQFVAEDHNGNIWMNTLESVGRYRLDKDSLILEDLFTIHDGLISPTIKELHIDPLGRVWTFSNSGMDCIDPETREVRNFGVREGLPNPFMDPVQVIDIGQNRVVTVSGNGLILFDAEALWHSAGPSREQVVIKNIRVSGLSLGKDSIVNQLTRLILKPGQKHIDIEFQALAFPTDYRMEYSYRVGGLQDEWISIGQNRIVTLPSLSPGEYSFEVKAGKPFSDAPVKTLVIDVATPIYLQPWFIILSLVILGALIYAVVEWRIRRIRHEEAQRTETNKKIAELELKALRAQMNPHFMFNSLNSIKNYILHAEPKRAAEYLSDFSHLIRLILQNSSEKSISLQEELETLTLYIELEQLRFDHEFEFSCLVEERLDLDNVKIPPMLLQPYVENAIWHGLMHKPDTGHLWLRFNRENGHIVCTIEDDGIGRQKAAELKSLSAARYKSMGMGITRDRIDLMNKMDALGITTEIVDKVNDAGEAEGTKVMLRIPGMNGLGTP